MMTHMLRRFVRDERGATAIEYGLIVALISVLAIGGMTLIATSINGAFTTVSDNL